MEKNHTIWKNVKIPAQLSDFKAKHFSDAIGFFLSSTPRLCDEITTLMSNECQTVQRKFRMTDEDVKKLNKLKELYKIPHDYQMVIAIIHHALKNPLFQ